MALEDKFLKSNVPGKWTDQSDDIREEADSYEMAHAAKAALQNDDASMLELAKQMAYEDVPEPIKLKILNDRMNKSQTGVKGVLADYRADCALKDAQVTARKAHREAVLNRMARGCVVPAELQEETFEAPTTVFQLEEEEDNDSDDEFMRDYRQKRLTGSVMEVGAEDYSKEVSGSSFTPPTDYVMVHMYEHNIPACRRLNDILDKVAEEQSQIKFLRIDVVEHNLGIDTATLPMITIYQGGEVVDCLAALSQPDELGEAFVKKDVDWMLGGYFKPVNGI